MSARVRDPETEFELVHAEFPRGALTGEVRCAECGRVACDVLEIDHRSGCPQSDVVEF
jgi:hypothetical protein